MGDTEFSNYGVVGPNNRYDMAVRKMVEDIYKGDTSKYTKHVHQIQEENFQPLDDSLKTKVNDTINNRYENLNNNPMNKNKNFIFYPTTEKDTTNYSPEYKGKVFGQSIKPNKPLARGG